MIPKDVLKMKNKIKQYLKSLGINTSRIKNVDLMLQAFTHKSYAADYKEDVSYNERLEFLGDSILGAVISSALYKDNPDYTEADLTLYKIALVREETLAAVAQEIKLYSVLILGRGEDRADGRHKSAILEDALEALIGYLYVDLGLPVAQNFIETYIYSRVKTIKECSIKSSKSLLQEYIQKHDQSLPEYIDLDHEVDDKGNVLTYKSEIYYNNKRIGEGFGTSKKKAQEDAATHAYEGLRGKIC